MILHRFTDAESRFAIGVPGGWRVETGGQLGSQLVLLAPAPPGEYQPSVIVTAQELGAVTREEHLAAARLHLAQFTGSPHFDGDAPVAEPPGAHLFEWTTRRPPIPLKGRLLTLLHGGRAYAVTATARPEQFEPLRADFDEVLRSFRVLDPAPASGSHSSA